MLLVVEGGHAVSQSEGEAVTGNSRFFWTAAVEENVFLGS